VLLCGGDKRTQARDVKRAKALAEELSERGEMVQTTRFDAAEYLDTAERQAEYVSAALETGDADFVRDAVGIVARARGMSEVARAAGLNRERLYKALGEAGNPEFSTMLGVMRALGLDLTVRPAKKKPARRRTGKAA
jgi:probable addiction module antidote protein